jgi:hypothetical protein
MNQRDRILAALRLGPVCGTQMLSWHIPRYSARIGELRVEGFEIIRRRCQLHYHDTAQFVYELEESDQLVLW